jgi:hypothetical protein
MKRILAWFRWHLYTAAQCERDMRRMTKGERGCASPSEHLLRGR